MAAFTMYLKDVICYVDDIGLDNYPIFDESYREGLNQKIVDHFWNREIGQETIEMFKFAMKRKMNEIMPYFNKLYLSEQLEYDPLKTIDLKTIQDGTINETSATSAESSGTVAVAATGGTHATGSDNGTVTSESATTNTDDENTDSSSRVIGSDFPQVMLSGNNDYASTGTDSTGKSKTHKEGVSSTAGEEISARNTVNDTESEENSNTTTSDETSGTVSRDNVSHNESVTNGFTHHPAELLMRYRETLLNIDMLVIDSLNELFMLIWDTGDSYTERNYGYGYTI